MLLRYFFAAAVIGLPVTDTVAVISEPNEQEKKTMVERQTINTPVPYVTLRNRTESSNPAEYFGGTRGQLSAGICTVSFSPIWGLDEIAQSAPFYIPAETMELTSVEKIELDKLFSEIGKFDCR